MTRSYTFDEVQEVVRPLTARAEKAEAEVERLRAAIGELAACSPEHLAKLPWSTYHVALRLVGTLRPTSAKKNGDDHG